MKTKKRGRQTILNTKLQKQICRLLAQGHTIKTVCEAVGIAERTYYDWQKHAHFSQATTRAIGQSKIFLVEKLRQSDDWRAQAFLLERRWPQEFGRSDARPLPKEQGSERKGPLIEYSVSLPDGRKIPTTFEEIQKVFGNFPIQDTHDAQPEQRSPNTASTQRPIVGAGGHVIGWTDEEASDGDADLP